MADSLVAGNANGSAVSELRALRLLPAGSRGRRIGIQHAKAFLGCFPHETGPRVNQFIFRIVAEVVVMMARCELEQAIIGGDVSIGITHDDVSIAYIRRLNSKANDGAHSRGHSAFFHAAGSSIELFVTDDPLFSQ